MHLFCTVRFPRPVHGQGLIRELFLCMDLQRSLSAFASCKYMKGCLIMQTILVVNNILFFCGIYIIRT